MAKTNGKAKGAKAPKVSASKPTDPFAGKSDLQRNALIEGARKTDEDEAGKAAGERGLVVDKAQKEKALALLRRAHREEAAWSKARDAKGSTPEHVELVQGLRAQKKVTARQLTKMRGEDCDSVQAAENVFYAERAVERAKVEAEEAKARAVLAEENRKAVEAKAAKVKELAGIG